MKKMFFVLLVMSQVVLAKEVVIIQKDKKFNVAEVTVQPGDTLVFSNQEKDITHNVYSLSAKNAFELKSQKPGSSSSVVFKDDGETEVECAIHPSMKLKVHVKK